MSAEQDAGKSGKKLAALLGLGSIMIRHEINEGGSVR